MVAAIAIGAFLMVAVLVAIAIPTFIGARERAQDRAAQASLLSTVTVAKSIYTYKRDYRYATATDLTREQPGVFFVNGTTDSTSPRTVSSGAIDTVTFVAAARSQSGTCWYIRDIASGSTLWNAVRRASSCRASLIPTTVWTPLPARPA